MTGSMRYNQIDGYEPGPPEPPPDGGDTTAPNQPTPTWETQNPSTW
jgi:hypothetical protein